MSSLVTLRSLLSNAWWWMEIPKNCSFCCRCFVTYLIVDWNQNFRSISIAVQLYQQRINTWSRGSQKKIVSEYRAEILLHFGNGNIRDEISKLQIDNVLSFSCEATNIHGCNFMLYIIPVNRHYLHNQNGIAEE
jgi:hypothetical protein